jgi:8-oxo-dGTP diphosphatase
MKKIVDVAAAVILRPDGSFLLGQRAPDTFYPGYWEFPGGKLEAGETPDAALVRELREELGIEAIEACPWITREHVYEHAHVRLHFFRVFGWRGEIRDHIHSALAWQGIGPPHVEPMLPANAPVLRALALPPLYAITHAWEIGARAQLERLAWALDHGLRLVLLREPAAEPSARDDFVRAAIGLAGRYRARVLVSRDAELARAFGADGVHLTSRQLMDTAARPDLPLVAASCHDEAELALAARLDLDFAVLGPVKPTASHPAEAGIGWRRYAGLVRNRPLPVYAIGGLGPNDLEEARRQGAHGIAAIRAAWA